MDENKNKKSIDQIIQKGNRYIDDKSREVTESIISAFLESLDDLPSEMTHVRIDCLRTIIHAQVKSAMHGVTNSNFEVLLEEISDG